MKNTLLKLKFQTGNLVCNNTAPSWRAMYVTYTGRRGKSVDYTPWMGDTPEAAVQRFVSRPVKYYCRSTPPTCRTILSFFFLITQLNTFLWWNKRKTYCTLYNRKYLHKLYMSFYVRRDTDSVPIRVEIIFFIFSPVFHVDFFRLKF